MRIAVTQRILGLLLLLFSTSMLPPVVVSLFYQDGSHHGFLYGFAVTALVGLLVWLPVRHDRREPRLRDGFLIVATFWVVLGSFGSAPLMFLEELELSITDAIFESVSGLTTTGATILSGLDHLPPSILYYRQQLQWLGGMGIVVLAVAVLPMLGVGGMQLYRAEIPGPVKDNKLTPRITETAKALWYIYLGLTVACVLSYWAAGMSLFDAIGHGFSTIAIGGFSTHDASIGHFDSRVIELIAVVFMFLAGINFSLHFVAWRNRSLQHYFNDPELRAYCAVLLGTLVFVLVTLDFTGQYALLQDTVANGLFQVVSIVTTTGFTTTDFSVWPGALPVVLLFGSFIGGCAGSTAGGMKVMRVLLLYKQGLREVRRLVHPSAEMPVKLGSVAVSPRIVDSVWGFFAIYVVLFVVMMVILLATGLDQVTAFAAIAASLNNLGPGLGDVATGFGQVNDVAKWVCIGAMLLGRLEIFTLMVLVSRTFWRP
ncbi:MAG TPA: potassium transporter [Chromatiales bacterium]|nr:potassium transporter [Chromatiales bacterium]